jgi:PASTA domain
MESAWEDMTPQQKRQLLPPVPDTAQVPPAVLFADTSPLHAMPSNLHIAQMLVLDGISTSIDMINIAYRALQAALLEFNRSMYQHRPPSRTLTVPAVMNAWTIIDADRRFSAHAAGMMRAGDSGCGPEGRGSSPLGHPSLFGCSSYLPSPGTGAIRNDCGVSNACTQGVVCAARDGGGADGGSPGRHAGMGTIGGRTATTVIPSGPWWRRWYVVVAAAAVALGLVALSDDGASNPGSPSTPAPTSLASLPTVATTVPSTAMSPPTTVAKVKVPKLVGMRLATARQALADRGLQATVRYGSTARYPAGTVISQSRQPGAGVLPDSRVTLVVAKAPPPPPSTAPPPPTTTPARNCDPSYPDACLDPGAADYDCAGGSGNGPQYVRGPIRVRPPDPFGLDRDGDGWGCEA